MTDFPILQFSDHAGEQSLRWRSENGSPPPKRVVTIDDTTPADLAFRLACEGTGLLWQGDFHNAKQLLQALQRRIDRRRTVSGNRAAAVAAPAMPAAFHAHRHAQAQRARILGMLLLRIEPGHRIALRRAPDVALACTEAYGPASEAYGVSLRELSGLIGAHEWRKKGVPLPQIGGRIHPHYGVFSPVRGEYLDLLMQAPLPSTSLAFDIGTGTGVIAALLARRGVAKVLATDLDPRALACARDNIFRLGLDDRVEVVEVDLFPQGRAPLVVCNPPWLPARPNSAIERAIYDPDHQMLKGFLGGLADHLSSPGEGWLIISDLAEHLGLRSRSALLAWIDDAGLRVIDRIDIRPRHAKVRDVADPLHDARAAEVTSLWRLAACGSPD